METTTTYQIEYLYCDVWTYWFAYPTKELAFKALESIGLEFKLRVVEVKTIKIVIEQSL